MLSTEHFLNGQPSSTLLVYFSGILGFSTDCRRFQLARQYYTKLSAMIYMQHILFLEQALPLRGYQFIGIPRRQEVRAFECLDEVRAKYMVLGSHKTAGRQLQEVIAFAAYSSITNCRVPLIVEYPYPIVAG
uniref:WGS project CBMG000000000 data, contig CS5907-c001548 n=1 Tax=Fusarium acuminatum CS5907 TaxID=1318461 RepID=A0A096PF66_9HYPO|nr:unnamed protein product [Fusarium acuminatum CS5907]